MSDTSDDEQCPVCGKPYVHEREEHSLERVSLREDFVACRLEPRHANASVYVHEPTDGTVETTRIINQIPDTNNTGSSPSIFGDEIGAPLPGQRATRPEINQRLSTTRTSRGGGFDIDADQTGGGSPDEDDDLIPDGSGGGVWHVVCHDCTRWEGLYDDEDIAEAIVNGHAGIGHDVEYAEVDA